MPAGQSLSAMLREPVEVVRHERGGGQLHGNKVSDAR